MVLFHVPVDTDTTTTTMIGSFCRFSLGGLGMFGALLEAANERRKALAEGHLGGNVWASLIQTCAAGAALFWYLDDPGLPTEPLDCLYFTVVTGTSVGYGDFAPTTRAGKLAVCGFAVLALQGLADVVDAAKDLWTGSAVCKVKDD